MTALPALLTRVTGTIAASALVLTGALATSASAATPCSQGGPGTTGAAGRLVCWQDDPNRKGSLTFYDASGQQVTAGSIDDGPFAAYYEASGGVLSVGDTSATAYYATPEKSDTASWSGVNQATSSQAQPADTSSLPGALKDSTHVVVRGDVADATFADYQVATFPNNLADTGYKDLYEVRVYTNPVSASDSFYATDIYVDPVTGAWSQVYPAPPAATVPSAPQSVQAGPGQLSASVSWTAPASNGGAAVTSYTVTLTPNPANGDAPTTKSVTGTSTVVTGLKAVPYDVTVIATNSAGDSPASSPVSVTPTPATAPSAPASASASARDTGALVSFTPPASDGASPVTGYHVVASTGQVLDVGPSATSALFTGLANGTSRTFTVQAQNAVGLGAAATTNAVVFYTPTLTLTRSAGTIVAGSAVKLTIKLTTAPAVARTVTLWSYPVGHTATHTSYTTSSTGGLVLYPKPKYTTSYKVTYAGDATHRAVSTALGKVLVRTKVTVTTPKSGTKTTTRTIKIAGTTYPVKAGTYVYLYRISSTGALTKLATTKTTSTGSWSFTRTFTRGTYVLQVRVAATSYNALGISARTTLYEV